MSNINNKKIIFVINKNFVTYLQLFLMNYFHIHILSHGDYNDYKMFYTWDQKYLNLNTNKNQIIVSAYGLPNLTTNKKFKNFDISINFDDKILYYDFIKNNLKKTYGLKLIPTFKNIPSVNFKNTFVIKHKNACSSNNLIILNDYIHNIFNLYDPTDYQIQQFIDFDYLYGVDCSCINGKIIGIYSYTKEKGVNKTDYIFGFDHVIKNYIEYEPVKKFIKKIIKKVKYNGFVEFEFLIKDNKFYILECNPRMSGAIFDTKYYEILIKPYIDNILGINNNHNNKKICMKRHFDNKYLRIFKLYSGLMFLTTKKIIVG